MALKHVVTGPVQQNFEQLDKRLALVEAKVDNRYEGTGTPEGVVAAPVGSIFTRTDGGIGSTLYVKESGTGNTGWAAK